MARCTTADCGRAGSRLVFVEAAEPPDWYDYCEECAAVLERVDRREVKEKPTTVVPSLFEVPDLDEAHPLSPFVATLRELIALNAKYRDALETIRIHAALDVSERGVQEAKRYVVLADDALIGR